MSPSVQKAILAVAVATVFAGGIRLYQLGTPQRKVFDELYYASDGCWYAGFDYRDCGLDADVERSWVHPPLGKTMIAWGIDLFGNRPFGWRFASAVAGTVTVALVGALAFVLTGSAVWAGAAALLLAAEHLHFVQSRVAMLDVFLALFVVLGYLLLVAERRRRDALEPSEPRPRIRALRLGAGAALGAAAAVKWSGALALAGAALLAFAWDVSHRREGGTQRPLLRAIREEWLGLSLAFVLLPLVVYVAAWTPWLQDRGFDVRELLSHHRLMADYHLTLSTVNEEGAPTHPYMSPAWTWLLLRRPVAYYWKGTDTTGAEIIGIGNPFLFWGALAVIPYLAIVWAWKRDWRAGAVLVPILAQYGPWLAVRRPLFLFYMTPVTPFLALGATRLVADLTNVSLRGRRLAILAAAAVIGVSVGLFAFFWPVLVGRPVPLSAWRARMWFPGWV